MFVHIETRQKLDFANLRLANPSVSIPPIPSAEDLLAMGYVRFQPTPMPDPGPFADVEEDTPAADGTQQWRVVPWALDDIAEALRETINAERNRREQGGFAYMGKVLDSDQVSCIRIGNAAIGAQAAIAAGLPLSIEWTCSDNSVLPMSAADVAGMPLALALHSDGLHQVARAKKAEVAALLAAGDRAGLESYDVMAGWPALS